VQEVITIVYETHSFSEDNERGAASGWAHSRLSAEGRRMAAELGRRRRDDGIAAVFSSDLRRAVETAEVALSGSDIPLLLDWRLRECDYGDLTQEPALEHIRDRANYLDTPYPGGESWQQAIDRVGRFLRDLPLRWQDRRVLVIGHVATRWGLDHHLGGARLDKLAAEEFAWQPGWEYSLDLKAAAGLTAPR
jgi:2,3-bisphosphoglycerate-dependent phosphoglycerate mutase